MTVVDGSVPPAPEAVPPWLRNAAELGWRVVVSVLLGAVLLYVAAVLSTVTASVLIAGIVAATFAPYVLGLRDRGWSRTKAAAVVTVGALVVVLGTLLAWFSVRETGDSPPVPSDKQDNSASRARQATSKAAASFDFYLLALTAHVAQTYGGLQRPAELARGGLAPWQVKRACEKLESDLGGRIPLEQIAADFDLSVSHFSRAFRVSTGLPPHQWLLRQRVNTAKQLMSVRDLPLSEIAISAGFANQSHFTRVFSSVAGISPAAWRRETQGAPEGET